MPSVGVPFDIDQLDISLVGTGFVVGVTLMGGIIGEASSHRLDAKKQLKGSVSIDIPRSVEDDLFIKSDVPTMSMTGVDEDTPVFFKGKNVIVQYFGQGILFQGRQLESQRSLTAVRDEFGFTQESWSVSMTATTSQERSVGYTIVAPNASAGNPVDVILERIPYVNEVYVHPSLAAFVAEVQVAAGHEPLMSAHDLLYRISRICSCYVLTDPAKASRILLLPYNYGVKWTLYDNDFPSYRSLTWKFFQPVTQVRVSPQNKPEVEEGEPEIDDIWFTKRFDGAIRNDKEIAVDVPFDEDQLELVAGRLPIRRSSFEYVDSVVLEFDGLLDFSQTPTRLEIWRKGQKYESAVIGVRHELTGSSWVTTLDCAPLYLLTRESDS